jgi:hypothetical protein
MTIYNIIDRSPSWALRDLGPRQNTIQHVRCFSFELTETVGFLVVPSGAAPRVSSISPVSILPVLPLFRFVHVVFSAVPPVSARNSASC